MAGAERNTAAPAARADRAPALPRRARARRLRAVLLPIAAALVVIAGTAVAGYLVGRPHSAAGGRQISSGTVALTPPAGWRRAASPAPIRGLRLRDPVGATAPRGGAELVAGSVPGLVFPDRLARHVDRTAPRPDPVRLGDLEAYRWRGLDAGDTKLTLLAAATGDGVIAVACTGSATGACERAATSLDAPGAGPASLDALAFYGSRLDQAIARLNRSRAADGARLRSATAPEAQAAAARDLARAHGRGRDALRDITVPPGAHDANGALTATLGRLARAYRSLAAAARKSDRSAYTAAGDSIDRWDRALRRELTRM
jgi:hypothetical protein